MGLGQFLCRFPGGRGRELKRGTLGLSGPGPEEASSEITLVMWESYVLQDGQTDFPTPSQNLLYAWEPLLLPSEFPYL